jgi:hypothetical protein|eukprot:COSAG01_NODE_5385_length_4293_cov_19.521221_6_plen_143_part_00
MLWFTALTMLAATTMACAGGLERLPACARLAITRMETRGLAAAACHRGSSARRMKLDDDDDDDDGYGQGRRRGWDGCHVKSGAECRLPGFAPTWDMRMSTIFMPCNDSGFHDVQEAVKYGVVSYDWCVHLFVRPHAHCCLAC